MYDKTILSELHTQAIGLLEGLRDYIKTGQDDDCRSLAPEDRMQLVRARSALTLQLTSLTAWILHRQAIAAGEVAAGVHEPDQLHDAMGVGGIDRMPERFSALMREGDALFRRVTALSAEETRQTADAGI